jgi:hypothetical protein
MIKRKEEKNMTVNWKTSKGQQVTVTVEVEEKKETTSTGWDAEVETGRVDVFTTITAEVAGMGVVGRARHIEDVPANDKGIVGKIGKLALTAENRKAVEDAIEAAKAECAEYQAYLAQCEENREAGLDYEARYNKIENNR